MKAQDRIYRIEKEFGHLVKDIILVYEDNGYFKLVIYLIDGSNLRVTERWEKNRLARYSYYWLDKKNQLRIGWDNAPHHKEMSTFPYHKHTGTDGTLYPSEQKNLEEVMKKIEDDFKRI